MSASEMLERLRLDDLRGEPGAKVAVPLGREATLDDLRITRLKTEIVEGQLIVILPSGDVPATAAGSIAVSLHQYAKAHGTGRAFMSRVSYVVDLPHRRALCPDASWYVGPGWDDFPRVPPAFAAEVRDAIDYGLEAEASIAAKIADYFAAGTRVVWDVDVLNEGVVRVHRADEPDRPTVYRRGEVAEAEPAVPGWRMPVDELFD